MENYLTVFEKVRIIGQRAEQISMGAPTEIDIQACNLTSALEIAEEELRQRKLPFKIRRTFPNGTYKEYSVSDLKWD